MLIMCFIVFFFFKQKTAYEMRISDWSSDLCSSDLSNYSGLGRLHLPAASVPTTIRSVMKRLVLTIMLILMPLQASWAVVSMYCGPTQTSCIDPCYPDSSEQRVYSTDVGKQSATTSDRSEEHTSELQSLMRISYAVFCLNKKKKRHS